MGNSILKRVSKGEIKGWVRGEILNDLPVDFFEDPVSSIQERGGEVGSTPTPFEWEKVFLKAR
jgi:hypothetical protein